MECQQILQKHGKWKKRGDVLPCVSCVILPCVWKHDCDKLVGGGMQSGHLEVSCISLLIEVDFCQAQRTVTVLPSCWKGSLCN